LPLRREALPTLCARGPHPVSDQLLRPRHVRLPDAQARDPPLLPRRGQGSQAAGHIRRALADANLRGGASDRRGSACSRATGGPPPTRLRQLQPHAPPPCVRHCRPSHPHRARALRRLGVGAPLLFCAADVLPARRLLRRHRRRLRWHNPIPLPGAIAHGQH